MLKEYSSMVKELLFPAWSSHTSSIEEHKSSAAQFMDEGCDAAVKSWMREGKTATCVKLTLTHMPQNY